MAGMTRDAIDRARAKARAAADLPRSTDPNHRRPFVLVTVRKDGNASGRIVR